MPSYSLTPNSSMDEYDTDHDTACFQSDKDFKTKENANPGRSKVLDSVDKSSQEIVAPTPRRSKRIKSSGLTESILIDSTSSAVAKSNKQGRPARFSRRDTTADEDDILKVASTKAAASSNMQSGAVRPSRRIIRVCPTNKSTKKSQLESDIDPRELNRIKNRDSNVVAVATLAKTGISAGNERASLSAKLKSDNGSLTMIDVLGPVYKVEDNQTLVVSSDLKEFDPARLSEEPYVESSYVQEDVPPASTNSAEINEQLSVVANKADAVEGDTARLLAPDNLSVTPLNPSESRLDRLSNKHYAEEPDELVEQLFLANNDYEVNKEDGMTGSTSLDDLSVTPLDPRDSGLIHFSHVVGDPNSHHSDKLITQLPVGNKDDPLKKVVGAAGLRAIGDMLTLTSGPKEPSLARLNDVHTDDDFGNVEGGKVASGNNSNELTKHLCAVDKTDDIKEGDTVPQPARNQPSAPPTNPKEPGLARLSNKHSAEELGEVSAAEPTRCGPLGPTKSSKSKVQILLDLSYLKSGVHAVNWTGSNAIASDIHCRRVMIILDNPRRAEDVVAMCLRNDNDMDLMELMRQFDYFSVSQS